MLIPISVSSGGLRKAAPTLWDWTARLCHTVPPGELTLLWAHCQCGVRRLQHGTSHTEYSILKEIPKDTGRSLRPWPTHFSFDDPHVTVSCPIPEEWNVIPTGQGESDRPCQALPSVLPVSRALFVSHDCSFCIKPNNTLSHGSLELRFWMLSCYIKLTVNTFALLFSC